MHPHKAHYDRHAGTADNQAFMKRISKERIDPPAVAPGASAADLIDSAFLSYNGGRLREGCQLYAKRMLAPDCTVGLALSGALTPAGLGISCLVPLVEAGFIDWIVSTGANLYHDTHYALGMDLYQAGPNLPDLELRENQVIRIYDIIFDYENLLGTDKFYRTLCRGEAFQGTFGTAEFHELVGKYLAEREEQTGVKGKSLLASAYRCGVPVFTSSPGDSSIGMNLAALMLEGNKLRIDPLRDVNQSASPGLSRQGRRPAPQRRVHSRRRLAEKLHAANGAADPGGARPGGERGTIIFSRSPTPVPTPAASAAPPPVRP